MTAEAKPVGPWLRRWRWVLVDAVIWLVAIYGAIRLRPSLTATSAFVAGIVAVFIAVRFADRSRHSRPARSADAGAGDDKAHVSQEQGPLLGRKSALMMLVTSGVVIASAAAARKVTPATVPATAGATPGLVAETARDWPSYIPVWAPATAYRRGQQVYSPNKAVVSANVSHTSSAVHATDKANWTPTAAYAGKATVFVMAGSNLRAALEAAPANSTVILEKGATFDIGSPIVLRASRLVVDAQGATLRIGAGPTGETATLDRMLTFAGTDQRVENAVFGPRKGGARSTDLESVNVRFEGGARNEIRDSTFNTGSLGAIGVWSGNEHRIVGNKVNGSAIGYSHNGASRTYVAGNTITNAPANALSGTGNGTKGVTYNDDCIIVDNVIKNPGRMGIEDIAQTRRTVIRGNIITNSADIAISAVGIGPLVQGNAITFSARPNAGIEATTDGGTISGNTITFTTSPGYKGAGVSINGCNFIEQSGVTVTGNMIHSPYYGIGINAGVSTATISNNTITNPVQQALGLDPTSAEAITCSGNQIRFSVPSRRLNRDGITVGNCPAVTVSGNTITYTLASGGGTANERPIRLMANNTILTGNSINGGGRKDAHLPVVSSGGATPSGLVITANQFRSGATMNVTGMVSPVVANNGGYP